jgi:hypothetical protein
MANDVSFQLNPANGGINWGFCSHGAKTKSEIEYAVQVDTSSVKGSGTT